MSNRSTPLVDILTDQVRTLTKATATGIFKVQLDDNGQLQNFHHPDNWLAVDAALLGMAPDTELTIAQVIAVFDREQPNFLLELNRSIAAGNLKFLRSARLVHSNGTERWLELTIFIERNGERRAVSLNGTVVDTTKEHLIKSDMQSLGLLLNDILLEVPVAIFRIDLQSRDAEIMSYASISGNWMVNASTLYGLPEGTLRTPFDTINHIHPEDRQQVSNVFNEAQEKAQPRYETEYRTLWPDGTLHWLASKAIIERDHHGNLVSLTGIQYDITDRKLQQERIEFLAAHDMLTNLPNRVLFMETLARAVAAGKRYGREFAVLYLDLDNFKLINDTLGHDAGDALLIEASHRFQGALRSCEFISRVGGDEFVIIAEAVALPSQAIVIAERLIQAAMQPFQLSGQDCQVTASIGISLFPRDGEDGYTLVKNADIALYLAKEEGRNNYQFYNPERAAKSLEERKYTKASKPT